MPEEQPDLFEQLLAFLQALVMPDWDDLIKLIPFVLLAVLFAFLIFMAWRWRGASARNQPRLLPRHAGTPPPGVHVSAPSRWPFVVPIGATFVIFGLVVPPRDAAGNALEPVNMPVLVAGLVVTVVGVVGWLREAMREWRHTALASEAAVSHAVLAPGAAQAAALPSGTFHSAPVPPQLALVPVDGPAAAPLPGVHVPGRRRWPFFAIAIVLVLYGAVFSPILLVGGVLLGVIAAADWLRDGGREYRSTEVEGPAPQAPPGVHMPGPSPWPFFAPIAIALVFYGVIFSPILIIGGVLLGVIAAAGWLRDAGREYRSTEQVGHAVPATLDPQVAWPRWVVTAFTGVILVCLLLLVLPTIGDWVGSFLPKEATPTPIAVPAKPEISAANAASFSSATLLVPADREFELVFHNTHAGVPHNVLIANGPDQATKYFDGEEITGPADVTYQVPSLAEGDYYFLCRIHPNMKGTVQARPESGPSGPPGSAGPGGGSPAPGASAGASPSP